MSGAAPLDVSRETSDKLTAFAALLEKWNAKINLISRSSVAEVWDRHILDSAQLFALAPGPGHWVDLGSGGGFPGIVVAILSQGAGTPHSMTMVESDQRKAAFLRTAVRELGLTAKVISDRIEKVPPLGADILSARALADLGTLLTFAERHLRPGGVALFPKGENWRKEHETAQSLWSYTCEPITSRTNSAAAVLKIKDIARV